VGVEDPALRRVLETQAAARLHLAQDGPIREGWELTRAIPRAKLRAVARNEIEHRFIAPEVLAHHRRLCEARGGGHGAPPDVKPEMRVAIRARQVECILTDLDVVSLVHTLTRFAHSPPLMCSVLSNAI
jgi:hypothetical protein